MAKHNDTGSWGEEVASQFLVGEGYAIRDRNWRAAPYEIDIVAMKDNRIVFVEVKTRSSFLSDPVLSITDKKKSHLVRAANAYMTCFHLPHEIQFDLIFISGDRDTYRIEHIADAFYPPLKTY